MSIVLFSSNIYLNFTLTQNNAMNFKPFVRKLKFLFSITIVCTICWWVLETQLEGEKWGKLFQLFFYCKKMRTMLEKNVKYFTQTTINNGKIYDIIFFCTLVCYIICNAKCQVDMMFIIDLISLYCHVWY